MLKNATVAVCYGGMQCGHLILVARGQFLNISLVGTKNTINTIITHNVNIIGCTSSILMLDVIGGWDALFGVPIYHISMRPRPTTQEAMNHSLIATFIHNVPLEISPKQCHTRAECCIGFVLKACNPLMILRCVHSMDGLGTFADDHVIGPAKYYTLYSGAKYKVWVWSHSQKVLCPQTTLNAP